MDNGKSDEPKLTVGLEGFLEGVEREVTGEDSSLGIVWSEEAAREKAGVPDPPEHMARPVWDVVGLWRDAATYTPGIVLHAPEEGREIRDSRPPNRLDEANVQGLEAPGEGD